MNDLIKLPNIGPVVAKQLNQVGIDSYEQLKKRGSKQTWLDIQHIDTSACIHRLYAFEAAIRFIKKSDLPPDVKADLKKFYNTHKMR